MTADVQTKDALISTAIFSRSTYSSRASGARTIQRVRSVRGKAWRRSRRAGPCTCGSFQDVAAPAEDEGGVVVERVQQPRQAGPSPLHGGCAAVFLGGCGFDQVEQVGSL